MTDLLSDSIHSFLSKDEEMIIHQEKNCVLFDLTLVCFGPIMCVFLN